MIDVLGPVAVAFCPSPPLLLPAVSGRAAEQTAGLRRACREAVEAMLAVRPEVVVVVGSGAPAGTRFGPGDVGSLRGFGVDLEIPFAGRARPGGRRLPLAHTLGAWLLDEAAHPGARLGVAPGELADAVRSLPGPVGVLAVGDGSARRTVSSPGYLDTAGQPFDEKVADALAAGNPDALAALDADEGERLLADGVPAWRAVGELLAGRRATPRLHLHEAPFGVGYLVADWYVP